MILPVQGATTATSDAIINRVYIAILALKGLNRTEQKIMKKETRVTSINSTKNS